MARVARRGTTQAAVSFLGLSVKAPDPTDAVMRDKAGVFSGTARIEARSFAFFHGFLGNYECVLCELIVIYVCYND